MKTDQPANFGKRNAGLFEFGGVWNSAGIAICRILRRTTSVGSLIVEFAANVLWIARKTVLRILRLECMGWSAGSRSHP